MIVLNFCLYLLQQINMNRKHFIKLAALAPLSGYTMSLNNLYNFSSSLKEGELMPSLFIGHGSPMNGIEENEFVQGFRNAVNDIPKPKAILCISAHWETKGTKVTAMENPKTIHDFGGFPEELYQVQYPAPGAPDLAKQLKEDITLTDIHLDQEWGLDHGAWTVIKHMYPDANIPVIQMSIDYTKPPKWHYELAQELATLRKKGILIIGSGNMVHNLGRVDWKRMNEIGYGFDWALEARELINKSVLEKKHSTLIDYKSQGSFMNLAIPTPEHFLPLLYTLGLQNDKDSISLFNDKAMAGSLTMTSVAIGKK